MYKSSIIKRHECFQNAIKFFRCHVTRTLNCLFSTARTVTQWNSWKRKGYDTIYLFLCVITFLLNRFVRIIPALCCGKQDILNSALNWYSVVERKLLITRLVWANSWLHIIVFAATSINAKRQAKRQAQQIVKL